MSKLISSLLSGAALIALILLLSNAETSALAEPLAPGEPVTLVAMPPVTTTAMSSLSITPTLYVVGTAHLDTQWRWTIQKTIDEYLKNTLDQNFALFDQYPNYVFSFEGAFRYMLMKEYYPERYARLKEYIAQGRWAVAGSSVDAGDVNVVSPEALLRQFLLGNNYFEDEFGRRSSDVFLPDCFGFGYALPSVAAHAGLKGFSTQKLTWGSAVGIPGQAFVLPDVGVWQGPDGASLIAVLNPGDYVSEIGRDLSRDAGWLARIATLGDRYGLYAGYRYFGVGDVGGAPQPASVAWLEKSTGGSGPVRVLSAPSDRLYLDITPEQKAQLPVYSGELLMTTHGTGAYTSQAAMKRWNRQNELLADAAERASVVADWLGTAEYPRHKLNEAWVRFLWHAFHDDLTGTSIPEAYHFSWNDEVLSLNQFAAILNNATGGIARALDARTLGEPLVVYNPLAIERQDVVEAAVRFEGKTPAAVRVYDDAGNEVPSQVVAVEGNVVRIVFLADLPPVGWAVFDVRPAESGCAMDTGLSITPSTLENARYRVTLDQNGDVASVLDKAAGREMLSAPLRLQLLDDWSPRWPAWEIQYADVQAGPRAFVDGPPEVTLVESGPARVALHVIRRKDGSTFAQRISLTPSGNRLEIDAWIDWRTQKTLLKAAFPLAVANPKATYDLGLGTIERPNNRPELYEVPAQQWADLAVPDGSYGVAILNDCKYGWDKPNDHTLRLTLLHTPGVYADSWLADQGTLDIGKHRLRYALVGHVGDWRSGDAPGEAARFNQPLLAFQTAKHGGALGKRFSFISVSDPRVAVRAIKQAERGQEVIVRLQETRGETVPNVAVSLGAGIVSARQVSGSEQPLGPAVVKDGRLVVSLSPYQPRTFAVTLALPLAFLSRPEAQPVSLPFDLDVISSDNNRADGDLAASRQDTDVHPTGGHTIPAELLPDLLISEDIPFQIGPKADGAYNALSCRGQTIPLTDAIRAGSNPSGTCLACRSTPLTAGQQDQYNCLYFLAAASGHDVQGLFTVNGQEHILTIQDYAKPVARWGREGDVGYIKRDPVAWVGTHRHAPGGNEAYTLVYLFKYAIDLPPDATSITLPDEPDILILAMTLANNPNDDVWAATPLYDELPFDERSFMPYAHTAPRRSRELTRPRQHRR